MDTISFRIKAISDFNDLKAGISQFQKNLSTLKLPPTFQRSITESFSQLDVALKNYQSRLDNGFKKKSDITGLEKEGEKIQKILNQIESQVDGLDFQKLKDSIQIDTKQLVEATKKAAELKKTLDSMMNTKHKNSAGKEVDSLSTAMEKLQKTSKSSKLNSVYELIDKGQLAEAKAELEKVGESIKKGFTNSDGTVRETFQKYEAAAKNLGESIDAAMESGDMSKLSKEYTEAKNKVQQLNDELDETRGKLAGEVKDAAGQLGGGFGKLKQEAEETARATQSMNSEMDQIKDRVKYFFSLTNAAMLLRRAIQDVFNTIKELDAVMTETAVVTDFSVGDMWEKLPEYTASAKALGVATKDLYAATTLYYQQGLDTNASMAAGVETMKMAKIAGMEASDATDAMTSALRGFNMEVNEANAQNVNDVYSKLAAITASDTEGIATAMSKTAAIAHSVGAEFENIAVFLAQGIETTRESADTIGTAMKTVLARFNEMKKDPAEIGEIDGEIVDANKVETALKSVGIALRDTNGEFRAADQVLLEVASKWDQMSTMQQRYIATTAAGSRQQSRFIAFMSNYDRTLQLQSAAYNSAGAAQQQYEKTLESLESKVARLKNTWDEFILGIVDSGFIKFLTDALQVVLSVVNKLSNLPGLLGPLTKIMMGAGALKGGKDLVNLLFSGIEAGKAGLKEGINFSKGFSEGVKSTAGSIGKSYEKVFANIRKNFQDLTKKTFSNKTIKNIDNIPELARKHRTAETNKNNDKIALEMLSSAGQGGSKEAADLQRELNDQTAKAAALETQYSEATAQTASALGVTTTALTQQGGALQTISALENAGLSRTYALAAAKSGLTAEQLKQIAVERLGAEATEEEIAAEMKKIILEKQSLVGKIKLTLATAKEAIAKKINAAAAAGEAAGQQASTIQKIAGKLATDALTASTVILTAAVIAAIAAVALLVVGIVALVKAAKENSLEYKMQQAAEETKRAEEAAKGAKTAYDELLNRKSSISDLEASLKNLTRGTLEWKQAMYDLNQQVLDLVKIYPELNKYITKSDGVLSISQEGWEYIQEQQLQAYETTVTRQNAAQYKEQALKRPTMDKPLLEKTQEDGYSQTENVMASLKKAFYGILQNISTGGYGIDPFYNAINTAVVAKQSGTTFEAAAEETYQISQQRESSVNYMKGQDIYEKLLEDYQSGITDIFGEDYLKDLYNVSTMKDKYNEEEGVEKLREAANEVATYANDLEAYNTTLEIFKDQIISSVDEIANSEYAEGLSGLMGEMAVNTFDDRKQQKLKEVGGKGYSELVTEYAQALGMSEDAIKEKYTNSKEDLEKLREDLATQLASDDINKASKEFVKKFQKLNKDTQKVLASLGDIDGFDPTLMAEFFSGENLVPTKVADFITNTSTGLGYSSIDEYAAAMGYENASAMQTDYETRLTAANDNRTKIKNDLKKNGDGLEFEEKVLDNLSNSALEKINSVFEKTGMNASGTKKTAATDFKDALEDLGVEGEKLTEVGNMLANVDFSNLESIEAFEDQLRGLGIEDTKIEALVGHMKELGNATREIDSQDIQKSASAFQALNKEIKDSPDSKTISADTYNQLVDSMPDLADSFMQTASGDFVYLGDNMAVLTSAVQANTDALVSQKLDDWRNEVDAAGIAQWMTDKYKGVQFDANSADGEWYEKTDGDNKAGTGSGMKGYIGAVLAHFKKNGIDASSLGIEGLNNDTDVTKLTHDQLVSIATALQTLGGNFDQLSSSTVALSDIMTMSANGVTEALSSGNLDAGTAGLYAETKAAELGMNSSFITGGEEMQGLGSKEDQLRAAQQNEMAIASFQTGIDFGNTAEEINTMTEALRQTEKYGEETDANLVKMAVSALNLQKGVDMLKDGWEDNYKTLKSNNKGTTTYAKALGSTKKAIKQMYGLQQDVSEEFLNTSENLELLNKGLNGDTEALNEFGKEVGKDMFKQLAANSAGMVTSVGESGEEIIGTFDDVWAPIEDGWQQIQDNIAQGLPPLEGVNTGPMIDSFNKLIEAGDMTAEQVQSALGSMGMSAEFKPNYKTVTHDVPVKTIKREVTDGPHEDGSMTLNETAWISDYVPVEEKVACPTIETISGGFSSGGMVNTNGNNSGGNNTGGSKSKPMKTSRFHNQEQRLESHTRKRNQLEEDYEKILEDENSTLQQVLDAQNAIVNSVNEQIKMAQALADAKKAAIREEFATNKALAKYAKYNEEKNIIEYETDENGKNLIDGLTDETIKEEFEEGWDLVTEYASGVNDLDDQIQEGKDKILELTKAGKLELDKSLNTLEKIEKIEHDVAMLEADRAIASERAFERAQALLNTYKQQRAALEDQLSTTKQLIAERSKQYNDALDKMNKRGFGEYIKEVNGVITVDMDWLSKQNADTQEFVNNQIDAINEAVDALRDAESAEKDLKQALIDLRQEMRDQGIALIEKVRETLINQYQKQIDRLSQENEAIQKAESDIFDSINKALQEERQQRQNDKTEEEISNKEARLAYLRADTTGANALEIKNLEKELEDKKLSYADTLIDQKLQTLQEQNNEAATQRERQIEIAQAQLDEYVRSGAISEEIRRIIDSSLMEDGSISKDSPLAKLITQSDEYAGKSFLEQSQVWKDLGTMAATYKALTKEVLGVGVKDGDSGYGKGQLVDKDEYGFGEGTTSVVTGEGVVTTRMGTGLLVHEGVYRDAVTGELTPEDGTMKVEGIEDWGERYKVSDARKILRYATRLDPIPEADREWADADRDGRISVLDARAALRNALKLEGRLNKNQVAEVESKIIDVLINNRDISAKDFEAKVTEIMNSYGIYRYKTGGLADFTGPAWLDGTKSRPELVLNQKDTQNFLQLKDILSSAMKNSSNIPAANSGDSHFEIHIEVEKLENDYDVDAVANRVKTIISQEAMYRNNNLIVR